MAQPLLPNPPREYDHEHITKMQDLIEELFLATMRVDIDNIVDVGTVILKSSDGLFWKLVVAPTTGALSTVSVTTDSNGNPIISDNPYV